MLVEQNEIKKVLYKEKPIAKLYARELGRCYYEAKTSLGLVRFIVKEKEMGETKFLAEMPAQLLIRWMQ